MADYYTNATFVVTATIAEANLLKEVRDLALHELSADEHAERYAKTTEAFKNAFPASEQSPFAALERHFSDSDYPVAGFSLEIEELDDGMAAIMIHGDSIEVETLANLLQTVCPSPLPCGFTYSYGSTKPRPDECGGGFVAIRKDRIDFFENGDTLKQVNAQATCEDHRNLVLTIRHAEHGLSFWNNDTGFGRTRRRDHILCVGSIELRRAHRRRSARMADHATVHTLLIVMGTGMLNPLPGNSVYPVMKQ